MLACAGLFKSGGSRLKLLKFVFNAKNRTQVVLVYLQPFLHNSLLKCALRPKIVKNSLKTFFWGLKAV